MVPEPLGAHSLAATVRDKSASLFRSSLRTATAKLPTFSMALRSWSKLTPKCLVQYLTSSVCRGDLASVGTALVVGAPCLPS